jgi:polyisoprenoid-binding protein YceI
VLALPLAVVGQEYHVDLGRENEVRFLSDAPIEDFDGVTDRIDGYLVLPRDEVGNADLSATEFYFEVDLASLDTGIGLRNRHMRDNYLETEKFPYAKYTGRIEHLQEEEDGRFSSRIAGVFSVHGVERQRVIECSGELVAQSVRVSCEFEVRLTDHDISVPRLMFLKINEVIDVHIDFFLSPAAADARGRV